MPKEPKPTKTTSETNKTGGMSPAARHHAREYAVQAMYQWQISDASINEIENEFLNHHIDKKLDMAYFKELIYGIPEHQALLDKKMITYLGRHIREIDPIELAVLRIAIYELIHRPDVPYRVIINEALELTKKFGSVDGHKFVNGILDRIAKECRVHELPQKKD